MHVRLPGVKSANSAGVKAGEGLRRLAGLGWRDAHRPGRRIEREGHGAAVGAVDDPDLRRGDHVRRLPAPLRLGPPPRSQHPGQDEQT